MAINVSWAVVQKTEEDDRTLGWTSFKDGTSLRRQDPKLSRSQKFNKIRVLRLRLAWYRMPLGVFCLYQNRKLIPTLGPFSRGRGFSPAFPRSAL